VLWPSTVAPATVGGAEFVGACVGAGAGGGAEDPAGRSATTCAIPPLEPPGFVDNREPVDPTDENTASARVDVAPTAAVRHLTFMPLVPVVGLSAEPYAVYRVRLELSRARDRQHAYLRVQDVLDSVPESPERQEAWRLANDRLGHPFACIRLSLPGLWLNDCLEDQHQTRGGCIHLIGVAA